MSSDLDAIRNHVAAAIGRAVVGNTEPPANGVVQLNCIVQVEGNGQVYEVTLIGALAIDLRLKETK